MSNTINPADRCAAVTPSDSTDLGSCRALYVGGSGDLAIMPRGNSAAVTLSNVPAGSFIPIRVSKVMSTSTTASLIVALY